MNNRLLKKAAIAILMLPVAATNVHAQSMAKRTAKKDKKEIETYFKAGIGYAFNHGGTVGYAGSSDITNAKFMVERKPTSFSAGAYVNLYGGVMISKHVGAELGLNMGVANKKYTYTEQVYATATNSAPNNFTSTYTTRGYGLILVSPAFILQSGGEKLNLYTRLGVSVPIMNNLEISSTHYPISNSRLNVVELFTMRTSVGFNGAAGVSIPAGKFMDVWCEVNMLSLTAYFKESEVTSFRVDGQEAVQSLTENDRRTIYVFSESSALPRSASQPDISITEAMSYNNVGLAVGITIRM
jgi:hypothetical protein